MSTKISKQPLSRRKKILFSLILFSFFTITLLLVAEIVLRKQGYRPWTIRQQFTSIEPAGRLNLPDPELGYLGRPGESRITLPGPYSFTITHLSNGFRITHPLNTYPGTPKPEIWVFGCSFTHGWSLNDEQTYPWLLQENFPDYEVVNFAIGGGSTLQSLIKFRKEIKNGKRPAVVILAYGSLHDMRNTLTRAWLKLRMTGSLGYIPGSLSLPYTRWPVKKPVEFLYLPIDYRGVPLLHYSAAANLLDDSLNTALEDSYHSHEISRAIIEEFAALSNANAIKFVVAGIVSDPKTADMLDYCRSRGMMVVDISVDLNVRENTNLPFDRHPSPLANQQYARKLTSYLCGTLLNGQTCEKGL